MINLGDSVNSEYDELAPSISPDGKYLYYGRRNHPLNTKSGRFGNCVDIFYSKLDTAGKWRPGLHMPPPFNERVFNSVESISADGNILYIRGAYKNGRFKGNGISKSYRQGGGWTYPERMKIKAFKRLNRGSQTNYFVANDGQVMLLSFCRTQGGLNNNIYVCFLREDGKSWSKPQELHYPINSKKSSDQSPFLASDNETMYFSSDREGGYGLNDIWMSRREDDTWLNWSDPIVIDTPVNSIDWEGYCTIDAKGEYIYLVSNFHSNGKSSDIVKSSLKERFRPKPVAMVQGRALTADMRPLQTLIRLMDVIDNTEYARTTSSAIDGSFKIALPLQKQFYIKAENKRYVPVLELVDLRKRKDEYQTVDKNIILYSMDNLANTLGMKAAELAEAVLIRNENTSDLILQNGKMIPLRIKEGNPIPTLDQTREVEYTYFIPINDFPGLTATEISDAKKNPSLKRTLEEDGEIIEFTSGRRFLLKKGKKGYYILPERPDGSYNKRDNPTYYTNISKTPVLALGGFSPEQKKLFINRLIVTNFRDDIQKETFKLPGSDLQYMVNKTEFNFSTVLQVKELAENLAFKPKALGDSLQYLPIALPQLATNSAVAFAGNTQMLVVVPLESFDLPESEAAELMKKPYLMSMAIAEGGQEFQLPSGKTFKLFPSASKKGEYTLVSAADQKKSIAVTTIPTQRLRGLTDEERASLNNGTTIAIGEKKPGEEKYEFSIPSGKKYELSKTSDGTLHIIPLFSDMNTLMLLNQLDQNFYLGDMGIGETVIIDNLFFDFDKDIIRRESYRSLNRLFDLLNDSPETEIMIIGHTDNVGNRPYNINLSYRRTESVRNYLIERGVDEKRIKVFGYGPDKPLTSNSSEDGRQINRRVEFTIMKN